MKLLALLNYLFLILLFLIPEIKSQDLNNADSTKPTQYRRGIELNENQQTYEDKYSGTNLNEEKRSLFPLRSTGVWTELNPKVPRVDYLGIGFVNKDTGWAVGDLGALIKTTDGGESWEVKETNTTTPILKVRSYNGQIVIASGFDGLILRSTNGGESWTQITSGVTGDLWGLQMLNDTLGWACGNANSLIKTTNGGETWQVETIPGYSSDLWWIDFLNKSYGYIAGNGGKVFKTTDGGNSWLEQQTIIITPLFTIDVIDSLHIAAAGAGGKHVYSTDGGLTWMETPMFQLPNSPVNCVKYINADTGYIVVGEDVGLYKTTNRGETWQTIANIGEFEIQLFSEQFIGYAAGTGLLINKAEGNLDIWHKLIINENFTDVFFTNEQRGFVISPPSGGKLYRTTNDGITWEENGPSGSGLFFTDSLTGFIGNPAYIWKTTDGGDSWYTTNGSNGASKIFFSNPTIGWALRDNIIYNTTDGGENWFTQFTAPLSIYFSSIYFADSLYGWTTNFGSRPFKTIDGGKNWVQQTNLSFYESDDIHFINHNNGFLIDFLKLYRTTDGGNSWPLLINSQYIIRTFGWINHQHGFITGDAIYETSDSGNTWTELLELRNIGLRKFRSPNNYVGYAVGDFGLVYKYIDTTIVPVELTSFSIETSNNIVTLKWSTATEINNFGFEVLKSSDKQNWKNIGFINGNGTTTSITYYQFQDKELMPGNYYYKLKQIDFNGEFNLSEIIEVNISIPLNFMLYQNFPNPFNPTTTIKYTIPETDLVNISLYSILGDKIIELINEEKQPGFYSITLNINNLSSGVYFYRMITGSGITAVNKLTVLK